MADPAEPQTLFNIILAALTGALAVLGTVLGWTVNGFKQDFKALQTTVAKLDKEYVPSEEIEKKYATRTELVALSAQIVTLISNQSEFFRDFREERNIMHESNNSKFERLAEEQRKFRHSVNNKLQRIAVFIAKNNGVDISSERESDNE